MFFLFSAKYFLLFERNIIKEQVRKSENIINLYQKYLDNSCNEQELKDILSHFEQSEQNPELKLMIRKELEHTGSEYERLPQVESILRKLDDAIDTKIINTTPKRISLFQKVTYRYSAAAVLFLLLSAGLFYSSIRLNLFDRYKSEYYNDVAPGTNRALLTLADGKKIQLDEALNGTLSSQSGILISKTANGQLRYQVSAATKTGEAKAAYNTISTPKGGTYEVILSDGTVVVLNAGSSLSFPISFGDKKDRHVILNGEAYFEVAHRRNQPFYVKSGDQLISVLGTHFNVNAYTDEHSVKTTLLQGSIQVSYPDGRNALLKPGQQAYVANGKLAVKDVNAESAIDWKKGEMDVKDEDFQATMRKIARWYDVDVVFLEDAPADLKLGGIISREKSIVTVLKVMELTGKVHFKVEGRRVTVMR